MNILLKTEAFNCKLFCIVAGGKPFNYDVIGQGFGSLRVQIIRHV
jgi:hypothetical protein